MDAKVIDHLLTHDPSTVAINLYSGHGYMIRYGDRDDEKIVIDFAVMNSKWDDLVSEKSSIELKRWASKFTKSLNMIYFASDARTMLKWHDSPENYIEAAYSMLSHYKLKKEDVLLLLQSAIALEFHQKWGKDLVNYL